MDAIMRVIMVLLLIWMSGCSPSPLDEDETVLRVGIENRPKTLDPRYATDAYGMRITQQLLFSTLVAQSDDLQIVPALATHWTIPDTRTYIFHLRDQVTFHDGAPLTATDVKFTFEHLMDKTQQSPFAAIYHNMIENIVVIDPLTIQFSLLKPVSSFLTNIIMPILPAHLAGKTDFGHLLVGSGPFKLVSLAATEIRLTANPTYYAGPPSLKKLTFKVVADDNTRFLKLRKGELDLVMNAIPASKIDQFKQPPLNENYQLIEGAGIAYSYLAFNLQDPAVADLRVRQAIAHGIELDALIKGRFHGHAIRAQGLLSPVNWYAAPEVTTYGYDPEQAKQLLDAAGLLDPDGQGPAPRLTLTLKTSNNAQAVGNGRVIKAQLARIGIELEIKSYEWGTLYGDIKAGHFQLTAMQWVGVTEPDFYYDLFHSSQWPPVGRNRGRYQDAGLDQLLEAGRFTLAPEKRKAIYAQVQEKVAHDLPYISLWHANNMTILHKRISGYRQHPMAAYFSFKDIVLND